MGMIMMISCNTLLRKSSGSSGAGRNFGSYYYFDFGQRRNVFERFVIIVIGLHRDSCHPVGLLRRPM